MVTLGALKVGRLVPIVVDDNAILLLGDCAACGEMLDVGTVALLDWMDTVVIHKRNNGNSCIKLYIQQYIIANPNLSIIDTMLTFGVSRPTVMRCRRRIKDVGTC